MLEENTRLGTMLKCLDAKSRITIWKDGNNKLFDGNVYHLYDMEHYHKAYVKYLRFDIEGIVVEVTEERQ